MAQDGGYTALRGRKYDRHACPGGIRGRRKSHAYGLGFEKKPLFYIDGKIKTQFFPDISPLLFPTKPRIAVILADFV